MAFNIEADPREMRNVMMENSWVMRPYLQTVGEYQASLTKAPQPTTGEHHGVLSERSAAIGARIPVGWKVG